MAAGFRLPLPLGAGSVPAAAAGFQSVLPVFLVVGTAVASIGGSLIRRRRTRTPWWTDDQIDKLLWALGISPPDRSRREKLAAARIGLADLVESGQPLRLDYPGDGTLLLHTIGQQIVLQGALRRHVETLIDDQEFLDLMDFLDD